MKSYWWLLLVAMFVSVPAHAKMKIKTDGINVYRVGTSLDLNLDLAYGQHGTGMFRTRVGVMEVREPYYFMFGPTLEVFNNRPLNLGIQAELMHLYTGLWLQLGPAMNTKNSSISGIVSVGWSVLGAEVRVSSSETLIMGKVRIPLGVLYVAFFE
jgi:hypothetical protein